MKHPSLKQTPYMEDNYKVFDLEIKIKTFFECYVLLYYLWLIPLYQLRK